MPCLVTLLNARDSHSWARTDAEHIWAHYPSTAPGSEATVALVYAMTTSGLTSHSQGVGDPAAAASTSRASAGTLMI